MKPQQKNQSDFVFFKNYETRWRDNDVYHHMNNAVFYEYVDSIVNYWLFKSGALAVPQGPVIGLVVETKCNYFSPLKFPGLIVCGLALDNIGDSSVSYSVGLFNEKDSCVAAQASLVHVYVDSKTRRPVKLPIKLVEALNSLANT